MRRKRIVWGIAVLAVAALVLLAAGLGQLDLFPEDRPVTLRALLAWMWQQYWEGLQAIEPVAPSGGGSLIFLVRIFFAIALALLPVSVVYFILSPELRKKVFREFLRLLLFIVALQVLSQVRFLDGASLSEPDGAEPNVQFDLPSMLDADFAYDSQPSRWIVYVVSLVVGLAVAYVAVRVGRRLLRARGDAAAPMERLAREARVAVDALQADADVRDVVTRCYAEMSRVVREERGLRRENSVTAREFERYLSQRGLPLSPVRTLTRLFEAVRYGANVPGDGARREAIESLRAIAEACRSAP